ncbi:MAG: hypothetical protein HDR21_05650 [Lachnospiraceae bacterium]|nr:hypothetical protein [Lachnospiraceae bacterium]
MGEGYALSRKEKMFLLSNDESNNSMLSDLLLAKQDDVRVHISKQSGTQQGGA